MLSMTNVKNMEILKGCTQNYKVQSLRYKAKIKKTSYIHVAQTNLSLNLPFPNRICFLFTEKS